MEDRLIQEELSLTERNREGEGESGGGDVDDFIGRNREADATNATLRMVHKRMASRELNHEIKQTSIA